MKDKKVDFSQHYHKRALQDLLFRWVDCRKRSILRKRFIGKKLRVLDLGCGSASITSRLVSSSVEVFGVDENLKLLALARKNGLKVRQGDFASIPFPKGFFDAVVSIDSIEHVESRHKAFSEICRVLKDNGEIILFTPSYDSPLWILAEKTVNFITGRPSGHVSPFNREAIIFFLKKYFRTVGPVKSINFSLGMCAWAKNKR